MAYYGVDMDVRVKEVCLQFKNIIRQKGGIGIRSLGRIFRQLDTDGSGALNAEEFEQGLAQFG